MEYCSGADLSFYLRYRGRIDTLDFIPRVYESNMVASRTEGKVFWPHPETGGLDERVTRCFLGQLGEFWSGGSHLQSPIQADIISAGRPLPSFAGSHPP